MYDLNEVFEKECHELGISYSGEFPFYFDSSSQIDFADVIAAMMWILKKRQDRNESN